MAKAKGKAKGKSRPFAILEEAEVPVEDLFDDPDNANVHPEENIQGIMASLQRFGQPERLVVRKSDRVVYCGNGRLEALRRLGRTTARIQYVQGTNDECRAYAIAANQTTRTSRFDLQVLAPQLEQLQEAGLLEASAHTQEDLDRLLEGLQQVDTPKDKPSGSKAALTVECPKCHHSFKVGGE